MRSVFWGDDSNSTWGKRRENDVDSSEDEDCKGWFAWGREVLSRSLRILLQTIFRSVRILIKNLFSYRFMVRIRSGREPNFMNTFV